MIRGEVGGRFIGPAIELDGHPFGRRFERQAVTAQQGGRFPRALLVCKSGQFDRVLREAEEGSRFRAWGDLLLSVWRNPANGQYMPRLTVRVTRLHVFDRRRQHAAIEQPGAPGEQPSDGAGRALPEGSVQVSGAPSTDTAPALLAQEIPVSNQVEDTP